MEEISLLRCAEAAPICQSVVLEGLHRADRTLSAALQSSAELSCGAFRSDCIAYCIASRPHVSAGPARNHSYLPLPQLTHCGWARCSGGVLAALLDSTETQPTAIDCVPDEGASQSVLGLARDCRAEREAAAASVASGEACRPVAVALAFVHAMNSAQDPEVADKLPPMTASMAAAMAPAAMAALATQLPCPEPTGARAEPSGDGQHWAVLVSCSGALQTAGALLSVILNNDSLLVAGLHTAVRAGHTLVHTIASCSADIANACSNSRSSLLDRSQTSPAVPSHRRRRRRCQLRPVVELWQLHWHSQKQCDLGQLCR